MKTSRAFTLVETMIAITILTLAISGAFLAANSSLLAAETSRDQLAASFLAQEGIEYLRAMRDDYYLSAYRTGGANVSSTAWSNFLSAAAPCRGSTCMLDPAQGMGVGPGLSLVSCSGANCLPLYRDANGYNEQNRGSKTPFTRTVRLADVSGAPVDPLGNPVDIRIVSTVSWSFHGVPYSVTASSHLTPWQ